MISLLGQAAPGAIPSELTALGIVVTVVGWMIWRFNRSDQDQAEQRKVTLADLAACEEKLEQARAEVSAQRHLKHAALNDLAVARGQVLIAKRCAEKCDCASMAPFLLVVED